MIREALWEKLAEAADAVAEAHEAYRLESTPSTRAAANNAARVWAERLGPLIGHEAAFQFESGLQRWLDANDRLARFTATMASAPTFDHSDEELMRGLRDEHDAALRDLEQIEKATLKALGDAAARDQMGA